MIERHKGYNLKIEREMINLLTLYKLSTSLSCKKIRHA